jgi:phospholipid/cholesterol/gamma-HCH transport system ATP-binding protein
VQANNMDTASAVVEPLPADVPVAAAERQVSPAIVFDHVSLAFDDHVVLRDLSFEVPAGALAILLGASGAGKSLILKLILGLLRPDAGRILVHGRRVDDMAERDLLRLRVDIGMLFQENALFDSLTVGENVGYRLREEAQLSEDEVCARIAEVLGFIGLAELTDRMPASLSGGQRRRVAIARAIAARPRLLLFDDPTTGLDPIIATTVDDEIVKLRDFEHVTCLVVTHQIRDAFYIATHQAVRRDGKLRIVAGGAQRAAQAQFMVLHDGRIHFRGTADELRNSQDRHLKEFLFRTLPPW